MATKTIEWVKAHELPTGGIESWGGSGVAYPEVTGYLIPTLWRYGEGDLALRLTDYVISVQTSNGAIPGMDGVYHTFDTAAVLEGIEASYLQTRAVKYAAAVIRAKRFIEQQRMTGGCLRRNPSESDTQVYTMRASAIIRDRGGLDYWTRPETVWYSYDNKKKQRTHYIAYALEGIWRMGEKRFVERWLERAEKWIDGQGMMPFWVYRDDRVEDTDTTATCQWAILFSWAGDKKTARLLRKGAESVLQPSGGLWHDKTDKREISWAAKYYLDLLLEGL